MIICSGENCLFDIYYIFKQNHWFDSIKLLERMIPPIHICIVHGNLGVMYNVRSTQPSNIGSSQEEHPHLLGHEA